MSPEGGTRAEKITECVVGRQCREEGRSNFDRLHVSIVMCITVNAIAIHYSPPRSVISFHVAARACPYLLRVFYALPKVQEMHSKNAKLSRATT